MEKKPLVSVIIPVYNTAKYLRQCLDSIVSQTLRNIEIICVDDGSSDNSLKILYEYAEKDERIQILQQKNKGAGTARNYGMTVAKGKYLSFLDSDDFFKLNLLELVSSIGESEKDDIVLYKFKKYNNITGYISKREFGLNNYYIPKKTPFSREDVIGGVYKISSVVPWNKLFLKSFIINNNLYFSETKHENDNSFVLSSLFLARRIGYIDESLVYYRVNRDTNIQSSVFKEPLCVYQISLDLINNLKNTDIWESIKPDVIKIIFNMNFVCLERYKLMNSQEAYNTLTIQLINGGFDVLGISEYNYKHFFDSSWYYNNFYIYLVNNKPVKYTNNTYVRFILKIYYHIIDCIYNSKIIHNLFTCYFWINITYMVIDKIKSTINF